MKRLARGVIFLLCIGMLLTPALAAGPEEQQETVIVYEDGSCLTITLTVYPFQSRSTARYGTKAYDYTDNSGSKVFTYTLEGWFTYDGTTSQATNVKGTAAIYKSGWSVQSHNEYCSGNTVYGTITASDSSTSKTIYGYITCDKNGNIR